MATQACDQRVTDDGARWTAVLQRDASQDGQFVYAVASTGIYCRPSCPSKRPAREQVWFYIDPRAAEIAGYRACLRCEPAASGPAAMTRRVFQARDYLDAHPDEAVTLERLGQIVGLSPHHLQRSFKRLTGLSPLAYRRARRLDRLKKGLRSGATVTRAMYDAGYGSSSRAYDQTARLGMTLATYRRGGRGARIRFTIVSAPIGHLLVAATDRGLCSVSLGDDSAVLETGLRREFPEAVVERADAELASWAATVANLALVSGGGTTGDLPLDIAGTAFQWRVWERLRQIPRGQSRSYGAIAAELGQPTAARAVARACASNPLALVIPCHRVVRNDGALGGYRWGLERKRRLLEGERNPSGGNIHF